MNTKTIIWFDNGNDENLTFSLAAQSYFIDDNGDFLLDRNGNRVRDGDLVREAVAPGNLDRVIAFTEKYSNTNPRMRTAHPFVTVFNAMWTDDVVMAYKSKVETAQATMTTFEIDSSSKTLQTQ